MIYTVIPEMIIYLKLVTDVSAKENKHQNTLLKI